MFNRSFQHLFDADTVAQRRAALGDVGAGARRLNLAAAWEALEETVQWTVWNKVHRIEDAVWDPRGKRALFEGLDSKKPEILFLGAADGYEAMQLMAMYPGGHAVLVDYDDYCRTDRFGEFPEAYPSSAPIPRRRAARLVPRPDEHRLRGGGHPRPEVRARSSTSWSASG